MITEYQDYIPQLKEMYPGLSEQQIGVIMRYGWRTYNSLARSGNDILLMDKLSQPRMISFLGDLFTDFNKAVRYWERKWKMHERYLYFKRGGVWGGYYYFGIRKKDLRGFLNRLNSKSSSTITLEKTILYADEMPVRRVRNLCRIYKVKYPIYLGYSYYAPEIRLNKKWISFVDTNDKRYERHY